MKRISILLLCFCSTITLSAQIPDIPAKAIYFVKAEGGWELYIKKLTGIGSVILTESQRDPEYQITAYSLRTLAKTSVNASEKRILNGRSLKNQDESIYLIDSTPEKVGTLGDFFHFFLTDEVVYGYTWARNGRMKIAAGVRINLRLFEKKYGDYSGRFKDQWIVLTPEDLPLEKAEVKPKPPTEQAKTETTIVLLHSSDVDAQIAPSPGPQASPSPAPITQGKTTTIAALEKIAGQAQTGQATRAAYGFLVVDTLTRFPFESIKETQPAGNAELNSSEEKVLCKYLFELDGTENSKTAGFVTYHLDAQGRLSRVNAYGKDNQLITVNIIDYGAGNEPLKIASYAKDGQPITAP